MTDTTYQRMLAKAIKEGIRVYPTTSPVDWKVSSSAGGVHYDTTRYSCNCRGFQRFGHCKHLALTQARYGRPEYAPAIRRTA